MEDYDLVIVGAGWHGLAMAKTYLEVVADANLIVVDSAASVGGTWAKERLYPGLKTNNAVGTYEFSDFKLVPEKYGLTAASKHIPGTVVHEYLHDFATHYSLYKNLKLNTKVDSATLLDNGSWELAISDSNQARELAGGEAAAANDTPVNARVINSKKLVFATGLTSQPFVPNYPGKDAFSGQIIHSKQLKAQADVLRSAQDVVVVGGNKSAWDVCYSAATNGAQVHLVVRPSGGGPSFVWPKEFFGTSLGRITATRFWTLFDPCIWAGLDGSGWARSFLHQTKVGRFLTRTVMGLLGSTMENIHGLSDRDGTRMLRPWVSPYWMGNSLSIHNYDTNWFDLARSGKVVVHVADVTSLGADGVHLSDGTTLKADVLACCTGWKAMPAVKIFPEDLPAKMGMPHRVATTDPLIEQVDAEILSQRPELVRGPTRRLPVDESALASTGASVSTATDQKTITNPYQLYRFLVPSDPTFLVYRNLAFIGAHLSLLAIPVAQVQALWITAFFTDNIPHLHHPNFASVRHSTLLHSEYERLRHPHAAGGSGARFPDITFDNVAYNDLLLHDLGLSFRRKTGAWASWRELFEPYGKEEYAGIVQEFNAVVAEREWRKIAGSGRGLTSGRGMSLREKIDTASLGSISESESEDDVVEEATAVTSGYQRE